MDLFKHKKRIALLGFPLLVLVCGAPFILNQSAEKNKTAVIINGKEFESEIVSDLKKMQEGLSGRGEICDSCGMLFEFQDSRRHPFVMNGMKFSLDILWISNGKVVYIEKNIPFDFKESLNPKVESDRVFEVKAGISDKFGFKIGDGVSLKK